MSFSAALLCFQICLIQNVFGQYGWYGDGYTISPFNYAPAWTGICGEPLGPYSYAGPYGYGAFDFPGRLIGPFAEDLATGPVDPYGGAGVGEVAVAGELPAGGATAVTGQVPILGAVEFAGPVRAAGTITIAGTCGCGCAGPYIY